MGSWNYGKSPFFETLGLNINNDYDSEIVEELYDTADQIINSYSFEYFEVQLHSGYYEGFYITIEDIKDFMEADDETLEKEISYLKQCLIDLVYETGVVVCNPGWCTSYLTPDESLNAISHIKII